MEEADFIDGGYPVVLRAGFYPAHILQMNRILGIVMDEQRFTPADETCQVLIGDHAHHILAVVRRQDGGQRHLDGLGLGPEMGGRVQLGEAVNEEGRQAQHGAQQGRAFAALQEQVFDAVKVWAFG